MCGRYALALRPSQVRQMLEDDGMSVADAPADDDVRQTYNFAPGYHGVVYRAATPDWGAGPRPQGHNAKAAKKDNDDHDDEDEDEDETKNPSSQSQVPSTEAGYRLQSMKWGLVPFWTKRNPDYSSLMRTINCRDDSLSTPGGMWATSKARKRCVVVAQGFFEWLKTGPRDKLPHFVKRADGRLMCFAGLWDCVQYEGTEDKHYTYTIITTDSNKQLKFLHDRMPVILEPDSEKLTTWLDPARHEWSRELQALLRPFDGDLEVYPVNKDVGKVGNNSPSFVIPLDSKENKSNIANFFANASQKKLGMKKENGQAKKQLGAEKSGGKGSGANKSGAKEPGAKDVGADDTGVEETIAAQSPDDNTDSKDPSIQKPPKRKAASASGESPPPSKKTPADRKKMSSTQNEHRSPIKTRAAGSQKITKFFGH